ncbi:unnamed protein product [Calypogeia fissa]
MVEVPTFKLNDSTSVPALALGVNGQALKKVNDLTESLTAVLLKALEFGYRHIDTAEVYKTEVAIGNALQEAFATGLVKREDVYVTTKITPSNLHIEEILPAIKRSLSNLQLDYVDMYLIHFPLRLKKGVRLIDANLDDRLPLDLQSTWEEMEKLVTLGLTKSIGVSNFCVKKLQELLLHAKTIPAVNQIELHPLWQQDKLRAYCQGKGIQVSAWSPLGAPGSNFGTLNVLNNPILKQIALEHQRSVAQIVLRWIHELGAIPIPRSSHEERLIENVSIWDFNLADEDHEKIKTVEQQSMFSVPEFIHRGKGVGIPTFAEFHDNG